MAQSKNFVAVIGFNLNFEDNGMRSVKVKAGDPISYDGGMVKGEGFEGRTITLKAAIDRGWLTPTKNGRGSKTASAPLPQEISLPNTTPRSDYDPLTGGNFETAIQNDGLNAPMKKLPITKQQDRVVATIESTQAPKEERRGTQITSSTVQPRKPPKMEIQRVDALNMGAQSEIPLKMTEKTASGTTGKKATPFTVDNTTPRIPTEGATMEEIQRAKGTNKPAALPVKQVDQGAEGTVVAKIEVKKPGTVTSVEGINLRKTESRAKSAKVTVSSPDMNLSTAADGQVVSTIKTASTEETPTEAPTENTGDDYLSMLPDDWGKMHWVKKEKFIKEIKDIGFVNFILSMEATPAIVKACKARQAALKG